MKSKTNGKACLDSIYEFPLAASRTGAFFNAHAYSTKIAPEAIGLMIASQTKPGATVFDGFGGSCSTGLGALLCSKPTDDMVKTAKRLRLPVRWGARRAVVYELSGLGAFIGRTLCSRPDVTAFQKWATRILDDCEREYGWIYGASTPSGKEGSIRFVVWSECIRCPRCGETSTFWDGCVRLAPAHIANTFRCPKCRRNSPAGECERASASTRDDVLGVSLKGRKRTPARIYGSGVEGTWSREPIVADRRLLDRIGKTPIPRAFPVAPMLGKGGTHWGDLYRSGYHEGITHVHHFYTRRNLLALAAVNERIALAPKSMRDVLSFWLSSYNSSHSTLMTRVVAKKGQPDLVVTSNQPGVLYISGLPVEKNVFEGLRRKLNVIARALECASESTSEVVVSQASSTSVDLPDESVDYIFTDPPFGGNIPYSEANFIAESWLGYVTDNTDEAIISSAQGKDNRSYEDLLARAFSEANRILKPTGKMNVVFHSAKRDVWSALVGAFDSSGLSVHASTILDKTQGSFKQVTTAGSVKGDALLLLTKERNFKMATPQTTDVVIRNVVQTALRNNDPQERSNQRLYARFITNYIGEHTSPPLSAGAFYKTLEQDFVRKGQLVLPD